MVQVNETGADTTKKASGMQDPHSPIRMPQVGVCTPTMSSDGRDLAATLQSVISISDGYEIHKLSKRRSPAPGSRSLSSGASSKSACRFLGSTVR